MVLDMVLKDLGNEKKIFRPLFLNPKWNAYHRSENKDMDLQVKPTGNPEQYWKAMKSDDGKALEELYQLYANPLYNYGVKFTSDGELVRECIQSLFVTLWTRRNTLRAPDNVRNYLFKALRLALFKNKKLQQLQDQFDQDENYNFMAMLSIEDEFIIGEDQQALQRHLQTGIDQLSSRQREAIFLRFYEGMSYTEVAQVMDISVKGTYKVMARAIDALRDKLDHSDFSLLLLLLSSKLFN